jgi:hypothetical protein
MTGGSSDTQFSETEAGLDTIADQIVDITPSQGL